MMWVDNTNNIGYKHPNECRHVASLRYVAHNRLCKMSCLQLVWHKPTPPIPHQLHTPPDETLKCLWAYKGLRSEKHTDHGWKSLTLPRKNINKIHSLS